MSEKQIAIIVVSGSDGGITWAGKIAKLFASNGIPSLALAYWKTKNTSKILSLIEIEIINSAVIWLKQSGYSKVGIYGVSKGAELALVSASLISQLEFVIAVSPACCVFEGIEKRSYSGTSSWTWQGKPMPFISFDGIRINSIKNALKNGEYGFNQQYLEVLANKKDESNTIKAENINGPILLLSAKEDAQWPAEKMGCMIYNRLKEKQFAFPFRHEAYAPASHILCPVSPLSRFAYRQERRFPKECARSRKEVFELSLEWLRGLTGD